MKLLLESWNNYLNEISNKGEYTKGPGITLSRLGGWSSKKQEKGITPEREGLWAFIYPYFEPFMVGSTDEYGITSGTNRPSKFELMKQSKGKQPSLKLKKSRYIGTLYTRLCDVPNSVDMGNGWCKTDADTLREYVFGKYHVEEFASQGVKRKENMARFSKDAFEVFVPNNKGKFVGK